MVASITYAVFSSCESKPKNLSEQLKDNVLSHLEKIDSTIFLDSFTVIRIDTIDRRFERIIDDTIYLREFMRVRTQLSNAQVEAKKDSTEFYQGEVNYMLTQIDSLNKEISKADTTSKLGLLVTCKIQLANSKGKQVGILYYFLDLTMTIRNSEMVDSMIYRLSHQLN
jgi:hypothetical protein